MASKVGTAATLLLRTVLYSTVQGCAVRCVQLVVDRAAVREGVACRYQQYVLEMHGTACTDTAESTRARDREIRDALTDKQAGLASTCTPALERLGSTNTHTPCRPSIQSQSGAAFFQLSSSRHGIL